MFGRRRAASIVIAAAGVVALSACTPAPAAAVVVAPPTSNSPNPDWIAGYWLSCDGIAQTSEVWIGAGSGLLLGANHGQGNGDPTFEFMRIAPGAGGVLAFFGSPAGAPAVEFPKVRQTATSVTFANPAHDFPQRISYTLESNRDLIGRIEGHINGKLESMEWRFRAAALGSRCTPQLSNTVSRELQ